jgi:hypothetical protein
MINVNSKKTHCLSQLVLIMLVVILSAGCYYPGEKNASIDEDSGQIFDFTSPPINIHFKLWVPNPIPRGEQILIEILDEVTGLPYNVMSFQLEKISENDYEFIKSFPAGSVIKYRYARMSDSKILEAQPGGDSVRYRLCHAPSNLVITDNLWGWQGELVDVPVGTLTGIIQDSDTQTPLPDILVSAAGQLTFTDANGNFVLDGLPPGVHNMVAYSMDGSHNTFQQGVRISTGLTTPTNIDLQVMPVVQVSFIVTPPDDIQGVPIYIAGNLKQLGNTFTDLAGSMSIYPKNMPALTPKEDGTYIIDLRLYAGTDLRFKFTLGDGFWNSERTEVGDGVTHQIIIPNQDIVINHQIETWQTKNFEPITIDIEIAPEISTDDEIFIQFNAGDWTEPIPLWPLGEGNYLQIIFSPLDKFSSIPYRFCRNSNCQSAISEKKSHGEVLVQPGTSPQTVDLTIDRWENWEPLNNSHDTNNFIPLPLNPKNYSTIIELTPEFDASWSVYAPFGLSTISEGGATHVLFTPRWDVKPEHNRFCPALGVTPFHYQLKNHLQYAKSLGLNRGLFPKFHYNGSVKGLINAIQPIHSHWGDSYRDFIINYAKIAELTKTEWLIIGGDAPFLTSKDRDFAEGPVNHQQDFFEEFWRDIILELRATYQGEILWAAGVNTSVDPLPEIISELDGVYLMVDSPLAGGISATSEEIIQGFNSLIDDHIYEVYRTTMKPIYLAFAYPSVEGAVQGCLLINQNCANDGLFLPGEISDLPIGLDEQSLIYSAILPIVSSRDWIAGTSIRGFQPAVVVQDGSSSISGKPIFPIIQDWFLRMKSP